MKTIRLIAALGLSLSLLVPAAAFAQINKPACTTEPCSAADVGPFLQGVSKKCGNTGDCELRDIETAVANIGNWILGIVGSLVFAAYIYGGIRWMTSGGSSEGVKVGKDAMKKATVGLVIVFVAYTGIYALKDTLQLGTATGSNVACSDSTVGRTCGTNKVCIKKDGAAACVTLCENKNGPGSNRYMCQDTATYSAEFKALCQPGLCDGGNSVLCCDTEAF